MYYIAVFRSRGGTNDGERVKHFESVADPVPEEVLQTYGAEGETLAIVLPDTARQHGLIDGDGRPVQIGKARTFTRVNRSVKG